MSDPFKREVHCILGLPFDVVDVATAASAIREAARRNRRCFVSTPNLNFVITATRDAAFRDSVIGSDLSLIDGMPIVWAAKLLGIGRLKRASGSDVFNQLRNGHRDPLRVYFFGGLDGAAQLACARLNESRSGLVCVGSENPGSGSVEEMSTDETVARINASGAEFVVVALGAKKGQSWIVRNRERLAAPVVSHLGAVLNFLAGTVRRAPPWMQRTGLEWIWRIKEEPTLWRRYVFDGFALVRLLVLRVVPFALVTRFQRPTREELDAARVAVTEGVGETVVGLSGAWMQENLGPLRECLSAIASRGTNLRLDLAGVTYVDSSFLGLALLLDGNRRARGGRLFFSRVDGRIRKIFRFACCEFLLSRTDADTAGARSGAAGAESVCGGADKNRRERLQ